MTRADYAPSETVAPTGGLIAGIDPASPAHRAGLAPGDRILSVDDQPVSDVLDWGWLSDEDAITVTILREDETNCAVRLAREDASPWGISFAEPLFDGVRRCIN